MRILQIAHSLAPASRGGIETYVDLIARGLTARGHEVVGLSGWEGTGPEAPLPPVRSGPMKSYRARGAPRGWDQLEGRSDLAREDLRRVLRDERIEVAHLHHWHDLSTESVRTCGEEGVPVVVTLHDDWTNCPLFFRLPDHRNPCPPDTARSTCARCLARFEASRGADLEEGLARRERVVREELDAASRVLVLSESQRRILQRIPAMSGRRLELLPLPGPRESLPLAARSGPREPGRLHTVTFGGLDPGKGLGAWVEAVERTDDPSRITVHHHGRILEPSFVRELRSKARRCELVLHGAYEEAELPARVLLADVAVFPSFYRETHGFAVDEALAIGLPVLVTDRGAPQERIGARGRVLPADDLHAWPAAIQRLLDDPEELASLQRAERPPPVEVEPHVECLERHYRSALASGVRLHREHQR